MGVDVDHVGGNEESEVVAVLKIALVASGATCIEAGLLITLCVCKELGEIH